MHKIFILSAALFFAACGRDSAALFEENMTLAERGDMGAQVAVAKAYQKGDGVQQSYVQSIKWYKKAAENGCADCDRKAADAAELQMIDLYHKGQGKFKAVKDALAE